MKFQAPAGVSGATLPTGRSALCDAEGVAELVGDVTEFEISELKRAGFTLLADEAAKPAKQPATPAA